MAELNYKFFSGNLDLEEVEEKGDKEYYVSGYLTTGKRDLVNDIVTSECQDDMLKQLKEKNIKIDVEHELWKKDNKTTIPAGRIVDAKKDSKGVWIKVHLNRNYPNFEGLLEQIQGKFIDAFSIAFRPLKFAKKKLKGIETRFLHKLILLNAAMTGNPANTGCLFGDVVTKSIEDYELEEKVRTEGGTKKEIHSDKWKRCVSKVKAQGGVDSPEAVCTAALGKESFKDISLFEDIKKKILEEIKMTEEEKPKETTPENDKEGEAEKKEVEDLKSEVKRLEEEVSGLKEEKGLLDQIEDLKSKVLERDEFKGVKEAEASTKKEAEVEEIKSNIAKLYALLEAPQLKGVQDPPPSEAAKSGDLKEKAETKTVSGPLDYIR